MFLEFQLMQAMIGAENSSYAISCIVVPMCYLYGNANLCFRYEPGTCVTVLLPHNNTHQELANAVLIMFRARISFWCMLQRLLSANTKARWGKSRHKNICSSTDAQKQPNDHCSLPRFGSLSKEYVTQLVHHAIVSCIAEVDPEAVIKTSFTERRIDDVSFAAPVATGDRHGPSYVWEEPDPGVVLGYLSQDPVHLERRRVLPEHTVVHPQPVVGPARVTLPSSVRCWSTSTTALVSSPLGRVPGCPYVH